MLKCRLRKKLQIAFKYKKETLKSFNEMKKVLKF